MKIKERLQKYFREKSAFKITTDFVFYLLILGMLLPFSRKPLATVLNKVIMHRPAVINTNRQVKLSDEDYEWMLMTMDGSPVSFSSFKGEIIFLSFWATWCPPCRAEMPDIQKLYNDYGKRINFVLASREEPSQIQNYLTDKNFDLPVYRLIQNPPDKLGTSSIPTTFLITGNGKISIRKTGAARWNGNYLRSYLDGILEK